MTIVGGLRSRLVYDSVWNMINDALTSIGWFDAGREHEDLTFLPEPVDPDEEVKLNTVVLTAEDAGTFDIEVGSQFADHNRTFYVDIYAENYSLGEHLAFDLRDIIEGRWPSHGRDYPGTHIYDYTQGTPPTIGFLEFDFVTVDRAIQSGQFVKPWQKYWWSIAFTATDSYGDENDDA